MIQTMRCILITPSIVLSIEVAHATPFALFLMHNGSQNLQHLSKNIYMYVAMEGAREVVGAESNAKNPWY